MTLFLISVCLMAGTLLFLKHYSNGHAPGGQGDHYKILNKPWRFQTGDDLSWRNPAYNDDGWEVVDLTAPPGAHDGDVGLSGYMPGWTSLGHADYAGYGWYRYKIPADSVPAGKLALLAPPAVDDAYQLYVNGDLLGSAGDFSKKIPLAYSIRPSFFLLPDSLSKDGQVTLAFRVWMSPGTLGQAPDLGGIHIAPVLGVKDTVESAYRFQWSQSIKGYIVEVVEPVIFILLAIGVFSVLKSKERFLLRKWLIVGLILLGLYRVNQAVYTWFQIEPTHAYDIISTVLLRPMILGSWLMAWWHWYQPRLPGRIPWLIAVLTILYICAAFLGLSWTTALADHDFFQNLTTYIRYLFLALLVLIVCGGIIQQPQKKWLGLLAVILLSVGLFAREFALLHLLPGIYFPYGVGVSLTQYVYAGFVIVIYIILYGYAIDHPSDRKTTNPL